MNRIEDGIVPDEPAYLRMTRLDLAWGILLALYYEPDRLHLRISSGKDGENPETSWICEMANHSPREGGRSLDVPVRLDATVREWIDGVRERLIKECRLADPWPEPNGDDRGAERIVLRDRAAHGDLHGMLEPNRLKEHLERISEAIRSNPESRLCELNFMSEEEIHRVQTEFNSTDRAYPAELSIHYAFMEQAAKTPEREAVCGQNGNLAYRELDRLSGLLAVSLRDRGAGPGSFVAITADRTPQMVIGILAILKAGAAYVPIDLRNPKEHNRKLLRDCEAVVAIAPASADLPEIPRLDPYDPIVYGAEPYHVPGDPDAPAYCLYTSGTTGVPKGVLIRHRSVVHYCSWFSSEFRISECPRVLQSANLTFDASVESIFGPLLHGGTIILIPSELLLHRRAFRSFVDRWRPQIVPLVPALLPLLDEGEKLDSVSSVLAGGDVLDPAMKLRLEGIGYDVYNLYGPTETTVTAIATEAKKTGRSIGRPIANTRIYILSGTLRMIPVGIYGEICIAGAGVGMGYLKREALTQERFVPNPYEPGQLFYRTGDLGRWLPDGTVEYRGRKDDQLKINGILVHPESVRLTLLEHPSVEEAFVLAGTGGASKKLYAFFTTRSPVKEFELRSYLQDLLPLASVPSRIVQIPAIPVNLNGKPDKRALLSLCE